jgi:hypothetical protein
MELKLASEKPHGTQVAPIIALAYAICCVWTGAPSLPTPGHDRLFATQTHSFSQPIQSLVVMSDMIRPYRSLPAISSCTLPQVSTFTEPTTSGNPGDTQYAQLLCGNARLTCFDRVVFSFCAPAAAASDTVSRLLSSSRSCWTCARARVPVATTHHHQHHLLIIKRHVQL